MKCSRCNKNYEDKECACPDCGEPNPASSGVYQSSTVLISAGRFGRFYRSVEELPARLRNRLEKSTTGRNSATILIADRRGRREIAKALNGFPTSARRRILQAVSTPEATAGGKGALTPRRKKIVLAALMFLVLVILVWIFGRFAS